MYFFHARSRLADCMLIVSAYRSLIEKTSLLVNPLKKIFVPRFSGKENSE